MKLQKTPLTQADRYVREIAKKEHPETVERLVRLVQQKYGLSEEEIMNIVQRPGLRLAMHPTRRLDLKHYVVTANARWYWLIIALSLLTVTVVLILPEIDPVVYLRYVLGSVFVLWMPGYCLVKSLFPGGRLEKLELVALSLGTSILLVPMVAFVLHYTPWGIRTDTVTTLLLTLTLAFSTLAIFREHRDLSNR